MLSHPAIRIGDTARFPLGRLCDPKAVIYPRTWAVVAFQPDGGIIVARRHDGIQRTVSPRAWTMYAHEARRPATSDRRAALDAMRARHGLARGYRWNPDTAPGPYYVTVIDGARSAFLAGPYATHKEALAAVDGARKVAEQKDPRACWYAYGTARASDGAQHRTVLGRI